MNCMIQAFTGAYRSKSPRTPSEILNRISAVMDTLSVQSVIIGWNTDAALYQALIEEVHNRGGKIFIWLPVFSEMSAFPGIYRAIDCSGAPHTQAVAGGDEDFSFLCPSHKQNLDMIKRIYENNFSMLPFDGVFLDKIRYSSFGNGFHAAMGCFCDECRRLYGKNGVDLGEILALLDEKEKAFLSPVALKGMRYAFGNPLIDRFFQVRADMITNAVFELVDWFKARNLMAGLDVYAPVFAYYVGQDISALAKKAAFIKPMLYRMTDSPAGIPYESRRMRGELHSYGCDIGNRLECLWGVDDICDDLSLRAQIERLKHVQCPIYIGMEVNHKPGICMADERYVVNTIGIIADSGLGCTLSWDVLSDTKNHLHAIADRFYTDI